MAFSELELAQIDKIVGGLCRQRTRPELRNKLSLEYQVKRHDVTLIERRPHWDGSAGITEHGIAKLKFTRSTGQWRLLWMRADLKWHAYKPQSSHPDLKDLVSEIDADPWGAFFG